MSFRFAQFLIRLCESDQVIRDGRSQNNSARAYVPPRESGPIWPTALETSSKVDTLYLGRFDLASTSL